MGYSLYFLMYLEDKGNKLLRNARKKLPVNMALCSGARSDHHTGYRNSGLKIKCGKFLSKLRLLKKGRALWCC